MKIREIGEGEFKVGSERDPLKSYDVDIINERDYSCNCPHYIYRCKRNGLKCKHIIAVLNMIDPEIMSCEKEIAMEV